MIPNRELEKVVKPERDTVIPVLGTYEKMFDSRTGCIRRGPRELQCGKSGRKVVEL